MLRTALLILCGAMLPVAATSPVAPTDPAPPAAETTLDVTVRYTGSGQVDKQKQIWVWLFDQQPDPAAHVPPVATLPLAVNGGVARFTGLTAPRVWVAVMYDERGGYAADGPPPGGSPAGAYIVNGEQAPVTPGPGAAIQITFNDQFRLP